MRKTQWDVDVGAVETAAAGAARHVAAPIRKVAVFVAHGMGQQIPFKTLDDVAQGLRAQDGGSPACEMRAVKFDDQWLYRAELTLNTGPDAVEAHIYEGYWAPLTEGKIDARGVISFLTGAGWNGVRNGTKVFCRWLFGGVKQFRSPIRIVLYLLVALATVSAMVAMNSTIAVVTVARAFLGPTPSWLTNGLFADLTTTFNMVVTVLAAFALSLGAVLLVRRVRAWLDRTRVASMVRKPWILLHGARAVRVVRKAWGAVTILLFIAAIAVVLLGAVSLGFIFYGHVKYSKTAALWTQILSQDSVDNFNNLFSFGATVGLLVIAGGFALYWVLRIAWAIWHELKVKNGRVLTGFVSLCCVLLVASIIVLAKQFMDVLQPLSTNANMQILHKGLAWPLLVFLSELVRRLLVQYVGDVAIYVTPHKLDAYYQLRSEIKDTVYRAAKAVYKQTEQTEQDSAGFLYEKVLMVGHSLGSVIAYDVLNRLINEDGQPGCALNVVDRTPLLLTFGSPLDKTAFIFALQGKKNTSEVREALAASVQPMITKYSLRPKRWINIYSRWDIISGQLEFYDPPGSMDLKRVENMVDPKATTLLAAHVEYWRNPKLFEELYEAL